MKLFTIILLFPLLFFCNKNCAQSNYSSTKWSKFMPQTVFVTYEYAHRNTLQSGIEFCINQNYNDKFFVGLGYGIGIEAGKTFGFPTAHLKFNSKEGYLCQLGFTNAKITTSTGITLYNAIDLQLGYSFPFHNESLPQLKGITFGITVRFSKNKKIFGSMK